jgi:hypothetical protein
MRVESWWLVLVGVGIMYLWVAILAAFLPMLQ